MNKYSFRILAGFAAIITVLASCEKPNTPGPEPQKEIAPLDSTIYVGIGKSGLANYTRYNFETCIKAAGAVPVFFDGYATEDKIAKEYISKVDALVIPGSNDNDTSSRSTYDLKILSEAVEQGKPLLGICWGCQMIGKMRGFKIGKVVTNFPDSEWTHSGFNETLGHPVIVDTTSTLYDLYRVDTLWVNSTHNNCILPENNPEAKGIRITGFAPDGVVESVQGCFYPEEAEMIVGVQFHPEKLYARANMQEHLVLFLNLVKKAKEVKYSNYEKLLREND